MDLNRALQLLYLSLFLTMSLETYVAVSMTFSGTTETVWGTIHVSSAEEPHATEGVVLEDYNDVSFRGPHHTRHRELEDKWEWDGTPVSSEYTGDFTDKIGSFSWFPIRWTWVAIGELGVGVIGIIGNLLVIIVLFQRRAKSRSTDTLIGALAVADLLTSVGLLPVSYAKTVPLSWLGQVYCRTVWLPIYMWAWAFMSGFVLSAISIERYIAVTHPIYFHRILTRRVVSEVVVILWIISMMLCIPAAFIVDVDKVNRRCAVVEMSYAVEVAFAFYVTIIQLFIPAVIMLVTQTLIAVKLKAQSKRLKASKSHHLAASRAVIKMMFIVIIAYIICWTPNRFILLITKLFRIQTKAKTQISEGSIVLAAVNSSINPIIYSVRYQEFRKAIKELFVGRKVYSKPPMFDDPIDQNTDSTHDGSA